MFLATRQTRAPASLASVLVRSVEPSSTTMVSVGKPHSSGGTARTTAATPSSSLSAGITTATAASPVWP